MVAEIFGSLSAFKTMLDMAKALKDMNDAAVRYGAVVELSEKILSAREAQSEALDRIRELEQEMVKFEDWENEKQRYQLQNLDVGAFVYALKETMSRGEPPHWLCTKCYGERKKGFLNHTYGTESGPDLRMHLWTCVSCDAISVRTRQVLTPEFARSPGASDATS
jgi:hypothetical protein